VSLRQAKERDPDFSQETQGEEERDHWGREETIEQEENKEQSDGGLISGGSEEEGIDHVVGEERGEEEEMEDKEEIEEDEEEMEDEEDDEEDREEMKEDEDEEEMEEDEDEEEMEDEEELEDEYPGNQEIEEEELEENTKGIEGEVYPEIPMKLFSSPLLRNPLFSEAKIDLRNTLLLLLKWQSKNHVSFPFPFEARLSFHFPF